MTHVLDNPMWSSLVGPHAHLGSRRGGAARYLPDVGPFAAFDRTEQGRRDLAELIGARGGPVAVVVPAPDGWQVDRLIEAVQLVDTAVDAVDDAEAVVLTPDDVPEMLDLVRRTEPGPFAPRTIELGAYLGIRRDGRLVAMAGERMRPVGYTEVSAVCTDPDHQGQGLAGRLVRAVVAGIRRRGDTAFLHVAVGNAGAVRLYEKLGFSYRRDVGFAVVGVDEEADQRSGRRRGRRPARDGRRPPAAAGGPAAPDRCC